jgi:predicted metal-dependent hydrolase
MTQSNRRELQYGNQIIPYELAYDGRRTLAISVHPDLRVTVAAPPGTPLAEIEARLLRRAPWILRKQRQYEIYLPHLPPRQYVSGETHRYQGRQYRLKLLAAPEEGVKLERSYLYVRLPDPQQRQRVRELLEAWYTARAREVFAERLAACFPKMRHIGVPYPKLAICVLSSRWGTTSASGRVTLNVKLIQVPRAYIDYVIYHELCHLQEPNHSPAYYRLLERVLPDWRERRARLNAFEFG